MITKDSTREEDQQAEVIIDPNDEEILKDFLQEVKEDEERESRVNDAVRKLVDLSKGAEVKKEDEDDKALVSSNTGN